MKHFKPTISQKESLSGVVCASSAFFIWGLSPVYWKVLRDIPALEIIMHRVIWSFLFLIIVLVFIGHWIEFATAVKKPRTFMILLPSTLLLGFNWFIYIWAVNNDHVLQASLGYFINPLINVLLGMVFLKERLRRLQTVSLILAGVAVLYLTFQYGEFPWIALSLAFAFEKWHRSVPWSASPLKCLFFQVLPWSIFYFCTLKVSAPYFISALKSTFSLWELLFLRLFRCCFSYWGHGG